MTSKNMQAAFWMWIRVLLQKADRGSGGKWNMCLTLALLRRLNLKSKNNRSDIRLQVLRSLLLDFAAVSLCLASLHLWRQMLM